MGSPCPARLPPGPCRPPVQSTAPGQGLREAERAERSFNPPGLAPSSRANDTYEDSSDPPTTSSSLPLLQSQVATGDLAEAANSRYLAAAPDLAPSALVCVVLYRLDKPERAERESGPSAAPHAERLRERSITTWQIALRRKTTRYSAPLAGHAVGQHPQRGRCNQVLFLETPFYLVTGRGERLSASCSPACGAHDSLRTRAALIGGRRSTP